MPTPKDGSKHMELVDTRPTLTSQEMRLLDAIAERTHDSASTLSEQFFSATDDLFYELSERASTNNEENLYFEAMRAIRVSRKEISRDFLQNLAAGFKKVDRIDPNGETRRSDSEELSLVGSEDLEIELAQKNMADRTRDTYKTELHDLVARLDAMASNCKITQHNNPLDPLALSRSFVRATTEHLKLDIKTRLIFFKLFEKHFLKQLGHLYSDANQVLIDAGILPKVPRTHNSEDSENAPASAIEAQEKIAEAQPFERFDDEPAGRPFQLESSALSSLMASIRAAKRANIPGAQQLGNYHFFSANPGAVMPVPELANRLTDNQFSIDEKLSSGAPQNLVPQIVSDILALNNPNEPQALEQPDEDIINLVALFFDKVLEDENLPLAVQSLVCRLQIPVLKVALHDKTFLTDEKHPARIMINTLTEAGLSFDESKPIERDPLYKVLTEGVHAINQQFKLDNHVFSDVTDKVREAMSAEAAKSELVESRTRQAETGKAKLKAARSFAQNTLYEKLKDAALPTAITDFLTNTWLQVLVITYVRGGKDSGEWVENEQVITDLIWASQRHNDEKSVARQQRLMPELLNRIEFGLELVIDNEDVRKTKTQEIDQSLQSVLADTPSDQLYRELSTEQRARLGKTDPEKKSWDEMTALERQQARYEELSSQFYLEAKHMSTGTWLEYMDDKRGKAIRCKLSAKIDSENYVFVNRFGFKALTKTRRQFAYDMQFKRARPLDTTPIFERLMDKVVGQIKSMSRDL